MRCVDAYDIVLLASTDFQAAIAALENPTTDPVMVSQALNELCALSDTLPKDQSRDLFGR